MPPSNLLLKCLIAVVCFSSLSTAAVFRQVSNQQIPGTDGINPRKGVNMAGLDLELAVLWSKNLSNSNLSDANLTAASLWGANLTDANITGATISRANLGRVRGLTSAHLYSTDNYQSGDLRGVGLGSNDLTGWNFANKNLNGSFFESSTLSGANFTNANLSNAALQMSNLADASLSGANIAGANLRGTTSLGLSSQQVYSTSSYQNGNLQGIGLRGNDLNGWSFAGQNLTEATLASSNLLNSNFNQAIIEGANLSNVTDGGFHQQQLYSTASYRRGDLSRVALGGNNLAGWNFSNQNLTDTDFFRSSMQGADLSNSVITGMVLGEDMTAEQIESTTSYQRNNLRRVFFNGTDLSGWDLSGQDLSGAYLAYSSVRNTDLSDATIEGANLGVTSGLTRDQLYSTRSYREKNLQGVGLNELDLSNWNFSGHDLRDTSLVLADLSGTRLSDARIQGADLGLTTDRGFTYQQLASTNSFRQGDLSGVSLRGNDIRGWDFHDQNLSSASFASATIDGADFAGAKIVGASFENTTSKGLMKDQFYSTASYRERDLRGIRLQSNNLRNWDFSEQDLTNADFSFSNLSNTNFADSDLTGALIMPSRGTNLTGANLKNASLQGTKTDVSAAFMDDRTTYNQWTVFPNGFKPQEAGLLYEETALGDFDANGSIDVGDADTLVSMINGGFVSKSYSVTQMLDINYDQSIDNHDLSSWVKDVASTWYGDANLDGRFDSGELVAVFKADLYESEDTGNATWSTGDWNADGNFDSGDLVLAFQDGGYEQGTLAATKSVPEPETGLLVVLAAVSMFVLRRGAR